MKGLSELATVMDRISNAWMQRLDAMSRWGILAVVAASLSVLAFLLYRVSASF